MTSIPVLLLLPFVSSAFDRCSSYSYCQAPAPDPSTYSRPYGMELLYAGAILRHGDRTPIDPLPADTWEAQVDSSTLETEQFPFRSFAGLLTRKGQEQHRELGSILASIYRDLLPDQYDPRRLRVQSTHFSRTFHSARSLLAGMYPMGHVEIPVEVQSSAPILVEQRVDCPRLKQLVKVHQEDAIYKHLLQQMESLQAKVNSSMPFFNLADNYFCRACHPNQSSDTRGPEDAGEFCRVSRSAFRFLLEESSKDRELSKLQSGSILHELLGEVERAAFQDSKMMSIFSAHDSTIAYLHGALQTGHYEWPPYAANLIFELWKSDESKPPNWNDQVPEPLLYLRVIYNGKVVPLHWCRFSDDRRVKEEFLCPLATFSEFVNHLVPLDFRSECLPTVFSAPF